MRSWKHNQVGNRKYKNKALWEGASRKVQGCGLLPSLPLPQASPDVVPRSTTTWSILCIHLSWVLINSILRILKIYLLFGADFPCSCTVFVLTQLPFEMLIRCLQVSICHLHYVSCQITQSAQNTLKGKCTCVTGSSFLPRRRAQHQKVIE